MMNAAPPAAKVAEPVPEVAFNSAVSAPAGKGDGATVTWTNAGTTAHSATAIDKSFNTRNLQPGETKSVAFSTPGTFVYHCVFHGNPDDKSDMIGTVVVEP